jgi:iron complex transport system substrate-binding protein
MSPNLTEMLFALGLDEQVVGVTSDSDYPPAAKTKPSVGTFWQPNIEAIIANSPDLVVTLDITRQFNLTDRLRRMGCRVLTVKIETIADLFAATAQVGKVVQRRSQAERLVSDLRARLDNLKAAASGDRARVLWVVQRHPLRVAGRNTFINEMLEIAGGENAVGDTPYKYPPIGAERIYTGAPDVIIESAMGRSDLAELREEATEYWSRYKGVPAVQNGRIYVINDDIISRLGPRIGEGVEAIAALLAAGQNEE